MVAPLLFNPRGDAWSITISRLWPTKENAGGREKGEEEEEAIVTNQSSQPGFLVRPSLYRPGEKTKRLRTQEAVT
jgi:hypothetical protein